MKISIITATFNSEKTIRDCLISILEQTYGEIELIVVDGNSSDNTIQYINEIESNNKKITLISEPDEGIYDALNKGLKLATGDIIGFVHSDDILAHNNIIEVILKAFIDNSVDGIYGNLLYVKYDNINSVVRDWKSKPFKNYLLNFGWMPAHPTLFLKKNVYQKFGRFNLDYRIAADYDFVLRIFKDKTLKFHYLPCTITKMRVGGESNKSFKNLMKKTREDLIVAKTNGFRYPFLTVGLKNVSKIPQWIFK